MNELFWAIVFGISFLHTLAWFQLYGSAKKGKEWIAHSPIWFLFPNYFDHSRAKKYCTFGRWSMAVPLVMVAVYFLAIT